MRPQAKANNASADKMSVIEDLMNLNHLELWRPFMEKYDCQVICEIGVREGHNLILMTEHNPKIAVGIDSWIDDGTISRNDLGFPQETLNQQHKNVLKMFADKPFVQIYREYSFDAVKRFPDEYFDLVYIDADHSYEGCLTDLINWYPKIKKGRFLIGDDYISALLPMTGVKFGVIEAVNNFAQKNNLTIFELPNCGWAIIK